MEYGAVKEYSYILTSGLVDGNEPTAQNGDCGRDCAALSVHSHINNINKANIQLLYLPLKQICQFNMLHYVRAAH